MILLNRNGCFIQSRSLLIAILKIWTPHHLPNIPLHLLLLNPAIAIPIVLFKCLLHLLLVRALDVLAVDSVLLDSLEGLTHHGLELLVVEFAVVILVVLGPDGVSYLVDCLRQLVVLARRLLLQLIQLLLLVLLVFDDLIVLL